MRDNIVKYLQKMAESDRRGTADIFYYTIRTSIEEMAPLENCDTSKFYYDEGTYNSIDEMIEELRREGCDEDYVRKAVKNVCEYGVKKVWHNRNMFLTESEARQHLKLNHYHYSSDAYVYVEHAWRSPEMLEFFKSLFEYFKVEKKWG